MSRAVLTGQTILVTGASGVGRRRVRMLAGEGANLPGCARLAKMLESPG